MLRILFAGVVLLHGLIHVMGFLKAFRLAELSQLPRDISRPAGLVWLLTAVLFTASIVLFLLRKDWWWLIAAPTLITSQCLIILSWSDAKFGTIANVIVLIPTIAAFGFWNFNRMVDGERTSSFVPQVGEKVVVTHEMVGGMPSVVRKWLERSNVVGREMAHAVQLKQSGSMRTEPEGRWMPVESDQWIKTEKPGFLWKAEVAAAPGIALVGRDKYIEGKGFLLIKVLGLVPVADAAGPDVDQGSMLRYMAEMAWFPSAALSSYLQWRPVDSLSAEVTMTYGGTTASGIFRFDESGDLKTFEAKRSYRRDSGSTLEDWFVQMEPDGYREFEGVRVPARSSVTWKLREGDFTWYTLEVKDIRYNLHEYSR